MSKEDVLEYVTKLVDALFGEVKEPSQDSKHKQMMRALYFARYAIQHPASIEPLSLQSLQSAYENWAKHHPELFLQTQV